MKLSLMPIWTYSGPTYCHWCHHVPLLVPYKVGLSLGPLIEWVCSLKHLVPNWQGPCTNKDGSWSHHLLEDVEDPADGIEDPGDGPKALVDCGEPLYGLEKHYWPILLSFMWIWNYTIYIQLWIHIYEFIHAHTMYISLFKLIRILQNYN